MDQDEILQKKIATLESLCDQLQTEMDYLDRLLMEVGFREGIKTLKKAACELLERNNENDQPSPGTGRPPSSP